MKQISFNSINYLLFLTVCVLVYYGIPTKVRWVVLLTGSLVFYMFAGVPMLPFLLFTSIIIWYASRRIDLLYQQADKEVQERGLKGKEKMEFLLPYKKKCRNYFLIPALVLVVGILAYCKFAKMIAGALSVLLGTGTLSLKVIVPLGISYYTFSSVGYLLDVYWRKQTYIKNYLKFLLCVCYFPQIVQGPIARYHKLAAQFDRENRFDFKRVCFGMQLMLYGYFKKMVLADRLALVTTKVFGNVENYEGLVFLIALVFSSFQIYMDFSGCMDIVCGTSQIFGIELDKNFERPFFSKNVAEFWRRWHITLGTWFKDYVYLPIATSPSLLKRTMKIKEKRGVVVAKTFSTAIPLLVVWFLTGLWHGTGMNYVVWGFYYGIIILCANVFSEEYKKMTAFFKIDTTTRSYQKFQMIRTFIAFTIGRLITAPGTLTATAQVIKNIFSEFNPWIFWDGTLYSLGLDFKDYMVVLFGLLFVWRVSRLQETTSVREVIAQKNIVIRWAIYYGAIFAIIIFGLYGAGYNASSFIYAQF